MPLGLLDDAALATGEVGVVHRAVVLERDLVQVVDDDVGSQSFLDDAAAGEPGDGSGQKERPLWKQRGLLRCYWVIPATGWPVAGGSRITYRLIMS